MCYRSRPYPLSLSRHEKKSAPTYSVVMTSPTRTHGLRIFHLGVPTLQWSICVPSVEIAPMLAACATLLIITSNAGLDWAIPVSGVISCRSACTTASVNTQIKILSTPLVRGQDFDGFRPEGGQEDPTHLPISHTSRCPFPGLQWEARVGKHRAASRLVHPSVVAVAQRSHSSALVARLGVANVPSSQSPILTVRSPNSSTTAPPR